MKCLLIALILMTKVGFAADTKKSKSRASTANKMTELGRIDSKTLDMAPENKNKEIVDETGLYTDKTSNVKVNFSCKSKDGHSIKQGEVGYEDCLQKVKNDKHNPHAPNADINVKFGD